MDGGGAGEPSEGLGEAMGGGPAFGLWKGTPMQIRGSNSFHSASVKHESDHHQCGRQTSAPGVSVPRTRGPAGTRQRFASGASEAGRVKAFAPRFGAVWDFSPDSSRRADRKGAGGGLLEHERYPGVSGARSARR